MGLHLPSNVHLQSSIPTATAPPQTRRSLMARSPEADQAAVLGSQEMPLNGSLGTFLVATGFVLFFVLLSAVALWKLHARRRRACLAEAVLGAGGVAVSPAQHRVVQRFRIVRLGNAGDDRDVEKGELGESVKKLKVPKIAVIPSSPQVKRTSAPLSPDGAMLRPPPPERSPLRPRPSSVLLPSQVLEADRNRTITKVDWLNGDRTKEMKSHIPAHAEKCRGAKKQGGKENAIPQHGDAAVVKNRTRSKGLGVHWA